MYTRVTVSCCLVVFLVLLGCPAIGDDLTAGFKDPPNTARARAYWNWLNGSVSLPALTRDLEEAKAKGMGGLEIWDCEAMRNPDGFVPAGPPFLGPKSIAAIQHCFREARRLDLELGMITSSGWNAGGPWVPPRLASKNLFPAGVTIEGGQQVTLKLPFPEVPQHCPMGANGLPQWYVDVAVLAWPNTADQTIADIKLVRNLTSHVDDGVLQWNAPEGSWQVMRYVCTNNGQQLIAASPNSKGPFIDFLDAEATRFHFQYIIDKLGLEKGGDPSPLKYLEVDSMELHPGIQWTPGFPKWFQHDHGYDVIAWLPVLSGWTVADEVASERFRYDYNKSVSDLLIFSHYTTGSKVCAEYGLQLAGEAGGPGPPIWNTCPVDALKALGNVDIPRGEFWIKHRNMFLVKEVSSAAHIYGKQIVDAESWTTWRRWTDGPFVRKRIVDRAFCEGLNRVTFHGFAHSPPEAGYPGRAYHAGVDMNPQVVWWSKARPLMDYLARCCYLLQQGRFVADVAYYYGDQAPNFWPAYHSVPEKPLLPGLGAGYDYDVVNTDVILNRLTVKDSRLVLPDGMSYRVLVLPDPCDLPPEVLEKLESMVADGATVIGPKPVHVPGRKDLARRTARLKFLADKMWGDGDSEAIQVNAYGKGTIVSGMTPRQWLAEQSIGPDFRCKTEGAKLDYIHRQTKGRDIYFVRNVSLSAVSAVCLFRVQGRPQLWHADTGRVEPIPVYQSSGNGMSLCLDLPAGGSVFVVFDSAGKPASFVSLVRRYARPDPSMPPTRIVARESGATAIETWQNGDYTLDDGKGNKTSLRVEDLPPPQMVEGPWKVAFTPGWGAPPTITLPRLTSWTEHELEGVKHYSGAGVYSKTIVAPSDWLGPGRSVLLDLGNVREIAEVHVNGKSAGVLWKPPFATDITALLKPGENTLEIEVMNMWINRLAGDMKLPVGKRFCRTNQTPDGEPFRIQPAGLLGPVRLLPGITVVP